MANHSSNSGISGLVASSISINEKIRRNKKQRRKN
jgi:hypothetical protein